MTNIVRLCSDILYQNIVISSTHEYIVENIYSAPRKILTLNYSNFDFESLIEHFESLSVMHISE